MDCERFAEVEPTWRTSRGRARTAEGAQAGPAAAALDQSCGGAGASQTADPPVGLWALVGTLCATKNPLKNSFTVEANGFWPIHG